MSETLVFGMGATGASCARYFARTGRPAVFCDTRARPPAMQEILKAMPTARCFVNGGLREIPRSVNRILLSPGSAAQAPAGGARERAGDARDQRSRSLRRPKTGPAWPALPAPTARAPWPRFCSACCGSRGWPPSAGANLGTPALDLLTSSNEIRVLELSSFQLERAAPLRLEAAVILNITPDHLDAHTDFESYAASKARIWLACAHCVLPASDSAVRAARAFAQGLRPAGVWRGPARQRPPGHCGKRFAGADPPRGEPR